jgi:hypothetical protein
MVGTCDNDIELSSDDAVTLMPLVGGSVERSVGIPVGSSAVVKGDDAAVGGAVVTT